MSFSYKKGNVTGSIPTGWLSDDMTVKLEPGKSERVLYARHSPIVI